MFTWQEWDALTGCWWDNNNELGSGGILTSPLSDYIAAHPNAAIVNASGVGGLRLAVGFASPTDLFDGNVDMVTVGVGGRNISYDFEPPSGCQKGDADGDFEDNNGHKHHGNFHDDSCENGGGRVEDDDRDSGKHFESTSVNSATFTFNADSEILTMVGSGLDDGIPVGFTMIAVDYGGVTPAIYSLTLTNGRTFTGALVSGSLLLQ